MTATFSKLILRFSSLILFFAGPTCSWGYYCKYKSITHFIFGLAACSGDYSLFSGSCNRRFGGRLPHERGFGAGVNRCCCFYPAPPACNVLSLQFPDG